MTRPKKDEQRKRYTIRLLASELEELQAEAERAGLTVSEYMRRRVLGRPVRSRVSSKAIAELSRLGGLQKLFLSKLPECRAELNKVLAEIIAAIKRLEHGEDDAEPVC